MPLLREAVAAKSLEVVAGYRLSDYASAGKADAYKAELLYQPVDAVRVRGSFQHAVRAPSIYELYLPQLSLLVQLNGPDPCNSTSDERTGPNGTQVTALCAAQGIPAELLPDFTYDEFEVPGVSGGNPDLQPEEADTYKAGVVLTSRSANRWLQQMQLSLDWYRIEIDGAITQPLVGHAVARCYDAQYNPSFSTDNTYCTYYRRDATTGHIVDAKEIYRNISVIRTSGVDVQFDWKVAVGPGTLATSWLVAWVDSFERSAGPGIRAEEFVGTGGGSVAAMLPEWKWNLRVDYAWSGFDVGTQWRYVDSMRDLQFPEFEIPSRDYFDVFASYDVDSGQLAGLSLHAGVENPADTQPPIFPSSTQANTDTSQYDTFGRRYYLRASYRF